MLASWSDLPKDLLENIFGRTFPRDHLEFTSVCSSWRSVGLQQHRYLPRQCVALVVPGQTPDSETRPLIEPVQGQYTKTAIDLQIPHNYYCCGSSLGWLVLVDDSFDMQLFNPMTGVRFQLPSGTSSQEFEDAGKYNVRKAVLSRDPCSSASPQTIVFILYGGEYSMAFCKLGDQKWTTIAKAEEDKRSYADVIYYNDKFYAVYNSATPGGVVACDVSDGDHPTVTDYAPPPVCEIFTKPRYLVESNGDLFQLRRHVGYDLDEGTYDGDSDNSDDFEGFDKYEFEEIEYGSEEEVGDGSVDDSDDGDNVEREYAEAMELIRRYRTFGFKIYKLIKCDGYLHGRWKKVDSIDDYAFFVGYNSSFSLSASDYFGCKPNSVYFTDSQTPYDSPEPIRHDIGVYNLEDKSVAEVYPMDAKPMRPPPFWFTPIPWKSQVGSMAGEKEQ